MINLDVKPKVESEFSGFFWMDWKNMMKYIIGFYHLVVTSKNWRSLDSKWRHLRSDQQMVMSLVTWSDVTSTPSTYSTKWRHFKWLADGRRSDVTWSDRHLKKVTSLLSSDEQMVEAKIACDATGFFI